MKLSVIIVTELKRDDYIRSCLDSLSRQKTKYVFEVIIVSYGKKNIDLQEWQSRGLSVKLIKVGRNNYCLKRNAGAKVARSEIVAYIDDDAVAGPGWIDAISKNFNTKWKMAGGRIEPVFETELPQNLKGYERLIGGFNYMPEIGYSSKTIIGCNMFLLRSWLLNNFFNEEIGSLNMASPRKLYGGDEVDMYRRIRSDMRGFIPEATVKHFIQKSSLTKSYIIKRAKALGYGKVVLNNIYHIDKKSYILIKYIKMMFKSIIIKPWQLSQKAIFYRCIGVFHAMVDVGQTNIVPNKTIKL